MGGSRKRCDIGRPHKRMRTTLIAATSVRADTYVGLVTVAADSVRASVDDKWHPRIRQIAPPPDR